MTDPNDIWRRTYQHPVAWEQHYPALALPDMLDATAKRVPDASAIDFMGRKFSYRAVATAANRVAAGLARLGVTKGDRIGLYLPNVPHYVAAYFGGLKIGAIVVNFSPLYTAAELEQQVEDSGVELLFTVSASALLPTALKVMRDSRVKRLVVGSVAGGLPAVKSIFYQLLKRGDIAAIPDDPTIIRFSRLMDNDGRYIAPSIDAEKDIALLQYTGGTTGTPKGAMLTHQNLAANARQVNQLDPEPDSEDRILGVLPLFHIFANTCVMNRTILRGGEMVLLPRFDAAQVLAAIERTKATSLPGVPTMYQALLDHSKTATADLSSLRVCISGGAPMPVEVKERFEEKSGAKLVEGYGLTESSGVVSTNPYEGLNKAGTIGQPIPGTSVVLVSQDDPLQPPPPGEPGEITVAGPQIMKGYWNRPDADANTFVDGRLRTGDVGLIDEEGYIRIVDRIKDMIMVGGFKVYPSQVEAQIYKHDAVKEALVIGTPDSYAGERPKAFVALNEGAQLSGDDLMGWLNSNLGKHERVVAVEIRESLPKTMVGKLSRKELQAEEAAKAPA